MITYNIVDIISNLITDQSDFIQSIVGINARHGITGMIYDKALKISQSTNKRFSHGEIINFINIFMITYWNINYICETLYFNMYKSFYLIKIKIILEEQDNNWIVDLALLVDHQCFKVQI